MANKGLICTSCGNKLRARDKFCANCGTSVEAMVAEGAVAAEPVKADSKPIPADTEKVPRDKKEKKPGWFYRRVVLYLLLLIVLVVGIGLVGVFFF